MLLGLLALGKLAVNLHGAYRRRKSRALGDSPNEHYVRAREYGSKARERADEAYRLGLKGKCDAALNVYEEAVFNHGIARANMRSAEEDDEARTHTQKVTYAVNDARHSVRACYAKQRGW